MVFQWHFTTTHTDRDPKTGCTSYCWPTSCSLGADLMPPVVDKLREIGQYILAHAPPTGPHR